jgi:O-antigen/teichoic acid export membrane protein
VSVAVELVLFPFSATFMSTQRYDLANLIGVTTRLLSAGLIYGAIKCGYGLVGISVAAALSNIVDYLARWRIAYRILPQLEVRRSLSNMRTCREIFSFGTWNFLISVAQSIFYYSDSIIIGAFMPIAALAPFALAAGLIRQLEGLLRPMDQVFFPAVTQLYAQNEQDTLRAVYLRGSRCFLVAVAISAVFAAVWAEDFYRLWVGEKYVSGRDFPSVALLFRILLIAMVGRLFTGLGTQVLLGSLRVKPLAILAFAEAVANALLSIALIWNHGLVGVALGTLVSVLVFRSFTIPVLVGRQLDVPIWVYVRHSALKPIFMAIVLFFVTTWIRQLEEPKHFAELIVQGMIAIVIAVPLALTIGLTGEDRTHFVYKPIIAAWSWLVKVVGLLPRT